MMKRFEASVAWGVLLIAGGVLFLLQNLGILGSGLALVWALLFAAAGVLFLFVFLSDRANWWAVIPGCVLLSIGILIGLDELAPMVSNLLGGALVLGAIGLSFWVIYFTKREYWWAIIPGGVMLTMAVITIVDSIAQDLEVGGILFLGLGATFGILSLLPHPQGRMKWPLIPAAVLLIMGVLLTAASVSVLNYIWPTALVLAGLYLVYRSLTSKQRI